MKRSNKQLLSAILAAALAAALVFSAFAAAPKRETLQTAVQSSAAWLVANVLIDLEDLEPYNNLDWAAFAVRRSGEEGYANYPKYIKKVVQQGVDGMGLNTLARIALVATEYSDFKTLDGADVFQAIAQCNLSKETMTGAVTYALLALDFAEYDAPEQKQALLDRLLDAQHADGGYNYMLKADPANSYSLDADTDSTAMALNALAPYREQPRVKQAVEDALAFIQSKQLPSGGFGDWGESPDSVAQVIIALCSLGIDPVSAPYVKQQDMISILLNYKNEDGGTKGWSGSSDAMSSYQTLCALAAYTRFLDGRPALFTGPDCTIAPPPDAEPTTTQKQTTTTQAATSTKPTATTTAATTATTAKPTKPTTVATTTAETAPAKNPDSPDTGVRTNAALYSCLLVASACAVVCLVRRNKEAGHAE